MNKHLVALTLSRKGKDRKEQTLPFEFYEQSGFPLCCMLFDRLKDFTKIKPRRNVLKVLGVPAENLGYLLGYYLQILYFGATQLIKIILFPSDFLPNLLASKPLHFRVIQFLTGKIIAEYQLVCLSLFHLSILGFLGISALQFVMYKYLLVTSIVQVTGEG